LCLKLSLFLTNLIDDFYCGDRCRNDSFFIAFRDVLFMLYTRVVCVVRGYLEEQFIVCLKLEDYLNLSHHICIYNMLIIVIYDIHIPMTMSLSLTLPGIGYNFK
jgi:hypothetical protein